jgi:hypothetical protein
MKRIKWNVDKANQLHENTPRGNVGFEECIIAIEAGLVLADIPNPSPHFGHQRMLVLHINDYAYVVPYVETDEEIFLKTVFPSRKHTAIYLKDQDHDD